MNTTPAAEPRELTLRSLVLGSLITLVFTAANVYFGLKAGLTFATSIPAAVISMAILRKARGVSIQENNIVQTVASAAGTLSAIIFVLPGLVMIGWWTGFPYWITFTICALGGVLGVMYSIPLRRALVTGSDLPYPEGVACAEVLKIGAYGKAEAGQGAPVESSQAGLWAVIMGSISAAVFALVVATQVFASDVAQFFRIGRGNGVSGYDFALSYALFAIGHLVGISVGVATFVGALIAWGGAVPYLSSLLADSGSAAQLAQTVWSTKVRFLGAGAIGVAAIWTLAKLVEPVVSGLRAALAASRVRAAGDAHTLPLTERDIPIGLVTGIALVCLVPIGALLAWLAGDDALREHRALLAIGSLVYIVLMSFLVSAVCGYMAGLIGASNSPLSGVGILVVICAALLLVVGVKPLLGADAGPALVAFALFTTSVVFAVACIANNNLQDLKTGQLVHATPWRQQVALVIGVIAGAAVIPPVLDLMQQAYGFAGAPGADPARALSAPQAALISALAKGVIQGDLDWNLIGGGALIGIAVIVLDEILSRSRGMRLPPLAVGLGIYLPTSTTLMISLGALVGWLYDRRADRQPNGEARKQLGVLLASGMIVGESLIGVLIAAIVVFSANPAPLSLIGPGYGDAGLWVGGIAFALSIIALYGWLNRLGGETR